MRFDLCGLFASEEGEGGVPQDLPDTSWAGEERRREGGDPSELMTPAVSPFPRKDAFQQRSEAINTMEIYY